ncbi:MAG TPA: polysaccharide biosynthesis C-terminal domain-containing protein [Baekduia sp.]
MTEGPARPEPVEDPGSELGTTDSRTVMAGGAWSLLLATVPPLQTLLISVAAARLLGAEDFGRQSFIAFISVSCVSVFAARVPAALARFGAEYLGAGQGGKVLTLLRWTWRAQILAGAVAAAGFVAAAVFGAEPSDAWVLAGLGTWVAAVQAAPSSFLVAAQRWRDMALPGLLTTVAALVVVVAVLELGGGIAGYFAVELAVVVVNLVWTQRLAARLQTRLPAAEPLEPDRLRELRSFMKASTFFAVIEFVVLSRSEVLFLSHFSGPVEVGYYSVAFAAAAAAARVPAMITGVAMPAVATLHGAGESERIRAGFWRATRLLIALCPTLVVAAAVLGTDLLGLVYGPEFHPAEPVLVILLAPSILLPIAGMADAVLWILGRIRFLVLWGTAAAVVNIVLALALIPWLDAIGAGIVNVVAQLVAGVPALWLAGRILAPSSVPVWLLRNSIVVAVVCGVAALAPMLLLGGVGGLVAGGALAGVALWLICGALPIVEAGDGAWLHGALGSRRPLAAVVGHVTQKSA